MDIGTIILCVLIADFLTGLFHWIEDTYGVPTWPLIGNNIIKANIEHHRSPTLITSMYGFFWRNIEGFVITIILFVTTYILFGVVSYPILLIGCLAAFGNETHVWVHRKEKDNNWIINFLQDSGIVISRRQHNKHHVAPYNKYFCTLTNFVNPTLELIRFWPCLEKMLSYIGIHQKRLSSERDGL